MSSRAFDDPEQEEQRLAAVAQIRQFGDPALRTPAAPVAAFDAPLREEVERMMRIMFAARGVGLAAPQLGALRRLIVARPGGEEEEEEGEPLALVNPVVVWRAEEEEVGEEGCLSLGEIVVDVSRPVAARIEARDPAGDELEIQAEGLVARVLQHEIDHLDGVLILDRTSPEQRREALRELRATAPA